MTTQTRGRAAHYVVTDRTGQPMTKADMRKWAARQAQIAAAEKRAKYARMTPAERLAEIRLHTNAVRNLRDGWRRRENDQAMLQRHADYELHAAQRAIALDDARRRQVVVAGMVYLAQKLTQRR